ncbi:unnamed protein product [Lathyrus sativus]|nr:unnamed protein product [Lathyrus sativus]
MKYFHRLLHQLSKVLDYNFHAKCENLQIIEISFSDDVLLFSRGDEKSVQLLIDQLQALSQSTGLMVDHAKCRVYFGGVENETKNNILAATSFMEGDLPFRYLGVPLTSKRLSTQHYMSLVDRIVNRICHRISKLLSYAGSEVKSRKSPIAWKMVCKPRRQGGLNVLDLSEWNTACLTKLLWNLCNKKDSLWVKWIYTFYFKTTDILQVQEKQSMSWIFKALLRHRTIIFAMEDWNEIERYSVGKVYQFLKKDEPDVG